MCSLGRAGLHTLVKAGLSGAYIGADFGRPTAGLGTPPEVDYVQHFLLEIWSFQSTQLGRL